MTEWLPMLKIETPENGKELAIKLAQVAGKKIQPDAEAREALRAGYANDADALIAVSHVVAVNFATIAAANDYWRTS